MDDDEYDIPLAPPLPNPKKRGRKKGVPAKNPRQSSKSSSSMNLNEDGTVQAKIESVRVSTFKPKTTIAAMNKQVQKRQIFNHLEDVVQMKLSEQ